MSNPGGRWYLSEGSTNLGDIAQNEGAIAELEARGYQVTLALNSTDQSAIAGLDCSYEFATAGTTWFQALKFALRMARSSVTGRSARRNRRRKPNSSDSLLASADLFVFPGGGVLTDRYLRTAVRWLLVSVAARLAGVPIVAIGQGIGPISSRHAQFVCRSVILQWKTVGVREILSLEITQCLTQGANRGSSTSLFLSGDDTLRHPAVLAQVQLLGRLGSPDSRTLAVNFRSGDFTGLKETHAQWLRSLVERALEFYDCDRVRFIIFHAEAGDNPSGVDAPAWVRSTLPVEYEIILPKSVSDALEAFKDCMAAIGTPYHFLALGVWSGLPCVGLSATPYMRQKLEGLAQFSEGMLRVHAIRSSEPRQEDSEFAFPVRESQSLIRLRSAVLEANSRVGNALRQQLPPIQF